MTRNLFAVAAAAVALAGCDKGTSSTTKSTTVSSGGGTAATHTESADGTKATKVSDTSGTDAKPTSGDGKPSGDGGTGLKLPSMTDVIAGKNEFRINTHTMFMSPTLKQGDTRELKITLKRGTEFKDDVALTADAPKGLEVKFPDSTISASEKEDVAMSVTVAKDAPLGKQDIKVTGKAKGGATHTYNVPVNVEASVAK